LSSEIFNLIGFFSRKNQEIQWLDGMAKANVPGHLWMGKQKGRGSSALNSLCL